MIQKRENRPPRAERRSVAAARRPPAALPAPGRAGGGWWCRRDGSRSVRAARSRCAGERHASAARDSGLEQLWMALGPRTGPSDPLRCTCGPCTLVTHMQSSDDQSLSVKLYCDYVAGQPCWSWDPNFAYSCDPPVDNWNRGDKFSERSTLRRGHDNRRVGRTTIHVYGGDPMAPRSSPSHLATPTRAAR